ncbi:FecR domain-containing protein [Phytopseudomonas daroniae]|uniref:FecR domain-containing protein n=1 Tax=Phytopseudomonas daroniae TaxID=2487519 RepID=UPI00103856AA|nr:FecR domain-containing protein [Pseudomonas daroniae]TBU78332.1 iron dicitrate transport regulator FecR [Pseudomonas daroniae]
MSMIDAQQRAALEQAAHWYTRLQCETAAPADHAAWQAWLHAAPVNHWAWQQAERLQQRLQRVPSDLTGRTLDLAGQARHDSRRSVLKGFALLLGGSAVGWTGYRQANDGPWLADYRSTVGERLPVALADGGQLLLNTDSAVDVRYDARQRLIRLRQGEVMITTAADPQKRPFYVQTPHGQIQALGTRFSVRLEDGRSEVAVYEHQVRITPSQGQPALLEPGQHSGFTSFGVRPAQPLDATQSAWSKGLLVANDQRLDAFLAELSRYRHGWLRCDPAIASLRISGTFRLDDSEQTLRAIASALPVRIEQRTRYWVTVRPA